MTKKQAKGPILVPVDFSPHSAAALLHACEMAHCMHRSIVVLHVVHDPAEMPGYYSKLTKKKNLVRLEDLARDMLDRFMHEFKRNHPGFKVLQKADVMLVLGLPVTRILQVVEKLHASQVVMGSQGHTGLQHLLLGSKAEQVVRLAPVPVTIVKAQ
ncbi:MAG: universal stress protein [Chromatiales bacterium]|jgi:nucleotide-binding universal stress UspA family protein